MLEQSAEYFCHENIHDFMTIIMSYHFWTLLYKILSIYSAGKSDSGGSPTEESSSLSTVSGIMSSAASSGSPDVGSSTTELSNTGSNTFTILDENKEKFNSLKIALDAAGITQETIKGLKLITIFAPTNEAFNKLPSSLLAELLKPENKETLTKILKNHIIKNQKVEISEGMSLYDENISLILL